MSDNPYAPPENFDIPVQTESDAEAVRKKHINTEASIKSIGILYWLAALFIGFVAVRMIVDPDATSEGITGTVEGVVPGILLSLLSLGQMATGFAIRKIKPWSRWVAGILSVIGLVGLIGFPIGTLINGYILYLIFGKKGKMVFSAPYQDIIAATPHIKYRTSKWVWIVLGVIILVIIIAIASVALS